MMLADETPAEAAVADVVDALFEMDVAVTALGDALDTVGAQLADDAELLAVYDAAWNAVDTFPTPTAECERAALRAVYDAGRAAQ